MLQSILLFFAALFLALGKGSINPGNAGTAPIPYRRFCLRVTSISLPISVSGCLTTPSPKPTHKHCRCTHLVAVAITYVLSVGPLLGFLIQNITEVDNIMNAVERVSHYSKSLFLSLCSRPRPPSYPPIRK